MKDWLPIHFKRWKKLTALLANSVEFAGTEKAVQTLEETPDCEISAEKPTTVELQGQAEEEQIITPVESQQSFETEDKIEETNNNLDQTLTAEEDSENASFQSEETVLSDVEDEPPTVREAKATHTVATEEATFSKAEIEQQTTSSFLSSINWSLQQKRIPQESISEQVSNTPNSVPTHRYTTVSEPARKSKKSDSTAAFFKTIPWDGKTALNSEELEEIESIHVDAPREDFHLDPRTNEDDSVNILTAGLLSAARTSDRLSEKPAVATADTSTRTYLSSIPW